MAAISAEAGGAEVGGVDYYLQEPLLLYEEPRGNRFKCILMKGTKTVYVVIRPDGTLGQVFIKIPANIVTKGNEFEPEMFTVGTSARYVSIPGTVRGESRVFKLYHIKDDGYPEFNIYISLLYVNEYTAIQASKILCTKRVIQERRRYDQLQKDLLNMEEDIDCSLPSGLKNVTLLGLGSLIKYYTSDDLPGEKKEEARRFLIHWEEYEDLRNEEAKLIRGDESPEWGPRGFYADPNSVW